MPGCIAIIVAAGRGTRFGGKLPKQYRHIAGQPLLRYSLERFANHDRIDGVRVVINPADRKHYDDAVADLDLFEPVDGGDHRQESVRKGIESLIDLQPDTVLIHDAARPFVDDTLIDRVISALEIHPGAIPALPQADTLKRGEDGLIRETVDRDGLWRAQTPQGFRFDAILAAHQQFADENLTDDAVLLEKAGLSVALVQGSEENNKVTTEQDLLRVRDASQTHSEYRTASGFDVHRFVDGDHVIICGVKIPHSHGLGGHSDADVGLHALTDALFGTIADGDIGSHFPPSDPTWKNADSALFLERAVDKIRSCAGHIIHADVTVICESPKIGPHREAMKSRVADILGIEPSRVSIKATTTEHLGFTGRGEGIAAQALATIRFHG